MTDKIITPELIGFAIWFANNFKTLPFNCSYFSVSKKYEINLVRQIINGDTGECINTPMRVSSNHKAPIYTEFSKEIIISIPEYNNANFIFYLVIWGVVMNSIEDEKSSDTYTLDHCVATILGIKLHILKGLFKMFELTPIELSLKRAANIRPYIS